MRFSPRTWSLLSLLLFVAAVFFWLKGNEYEARKKKSIPAVATTNKQSAKIDLLSTRASGMALAQLGQSSSTVSTGPNDSPSDDEIDKLYPDRLKNTKKSLRDLVRDDHALLLANALIDTASGERLNIPQHLRASGDAGSYIVQWTGPATAEFRAQLAAAGAEIVSYVPNNAYYVKVDADGAKRLEQTAGVQAVIPFEPYYKLQRDLLRLAIAQEVLPAEALLRLTLLPGTRDNALQSVTTLGAQVLAEEPSPFGPQLIVLPAIDTLSELAALQDVQGIEPVSARKAASDLSRIMLGIATNGFATNYLNLTGSNVWVNVNDTGIDTNHPSLTDTSVTVPPPPLKMAGDDPDGHGTFVASLIAGNGDQSPSSISGSESNAVFRGIATGAKLLALPLNAGGGSDDFPALNDKVLDTWLIDSAARTNYIALRRTNSLISNNSWTYGTAVYDSAAARYDAAVRDAIPGLTGSQPLLFVFAAGNSGFANDDGTGGTVDSIESPGTAKNVITVSALENYRLMTNIFFTVTNTEVDEITGETVTNVITQYPFSAMTDSSNQVAAYSSRGNVGIGIEGTVGRFKPDVVAPGTMLLSARSKGWKLTGFDTNEPLGKALLDLQTNVEPYRFDSGTTFAAANISGMLALIQQYFESLSPASVRGSLSPAMMKALLVNGARSLTELYDIAAKTSGNAQGWGLPYLPNMLPSYSTNSHTSIDSKKLRLQTIEQSAANALATGQSRTWKVTLSSNALVYPFRVTLAWTDPPGNPSVGVKLVNDLDLIVTNLDTGTVYYGNDVAPESDFTTGVVPIPGNVEPVDFVNNVENVAIRNPKQLGSEFSVTVRARRVNVNSVSDFLSRTGNTNDVAQDFALVISSDMGSDPGANDTETYLPDLDVFDNFQAPTGLDPGLPKGLSVITNGLPLLAERVGANATLVSSNGITNQWNFYVFTNTSISNAFVNVKAGSNVAFVTFNPPNLARPRTEEADIDIYVSLNPQLTNLVPAVINSPATLKSTERGGTETISLTNGILGQVFYIGIKSEDQQGAEYSLMGVSSDLPFEQEQNGRIVLNGIPIYAYVPDGTARKPVAGTMMAIGTSTRRVARPVLQTTVIHENFGDLVGVLSHSGTSSTLNNHRSLNPGTNTLVFDDNTFAAASPALRSDGPGTLNDFAGLRISGAWILEMIDNAPGHTGRVENLTITIDPLRPPLLSGQSINDTLLANQIAFYPIDVGSGVTNLLFTITNQIPLEVYFRQFELPQTNAFDIKTNAIPPSTRFTFPTTNTAPLAPGTHFIAVRNPNSVSVPFSLRVDFGFGVRPGDTFNFAGEAPRPRDDSTTNTTIYVQNDKLVARAQVSLHMPYPRMSDLAVSLLTPQGTRILLAENRGGTNNGFGATTLVTNASGTNIVVAYTIFTDDTNLAQVPIKFGAPIIAKNAASTGLISSNSFETLPPGPVFLGESFDGWTAVAGDLEVIGQGGYNGNQLLELAGSGIQRSINTELGATYRVSFASRKPGRDYLYWTERGPGSITNSGANYLRRIDLGNLTGPIDTLITTNAIGAFGGLSIDVLSGYIYTGDRQFLFRTDLAGQQRTNLVATQNAVSDVEVDTANSWIYWAESGPFTRTNSIKRARLDGKNVQVLFQVQIGQISGIALDAARNTLYFTFSLNSGRDTVQAIDIPTRQTRVVSTLAHAGIDPFDIDFNSNSQSLIYNQIGTRSFWEFERNGINPRALFTNAFQTINGFAIDTAARRIIFNAPNTIYSRPLNGIGPATILVRSRETVNYEEIAHSVQGSGATVPLVAEVSLGPVTNSLPGSADWVVNTFYFTGRGGSEPLTIRSREGGLWVDNVIVERVADTFVLPEEPLSGIVGERSIGEWRLDVQDTRTGAFLPAGSFDWKLDLNFADPVIFAETLTGGSRFSVSTRSTVNDPSRFTPGVLRTNQVHYFIIQPCAGARNLSVVLGGVRNFDGIELLADSSGLPTSDPETDDFVPMRNNQNPNSPNGVLEFRLSDRLPAPARLTSKPIFVAIRNRFQGVTNIYSLMVTSDGNCSSSTATSATSALAANVSEVSALPGASEYSAEQAGLHEMNIPAGAEAVTVSVEADDDVSLIAQKDAPPTLDSFSHFQNVPGASEQLTITANSGVPLTPGLWYVRVLNNSENPIAYTITASGDITSEPTVLSVVAEIADGQIRLSWNAVEGAGYAVQSSSDLSNWSSVAILPEGTSTYALPGLDGLARFYRVVGQ